MKIYSIKPFFQKILMPIANIMIKLKIHPTLINIAALIVSILSGVLLTLINLNKYLILIIPFLLFIRIAFNALDGIVARGLQLSSSKGEVYNEFIDRICDAVIFIGLLFLFLEKISFYKHLIIQYQFILGVIFIILFLLAR